MMCRFTISKVAMVLLALVPWIQEVLGDQTSTISKSLQLFPKKTNPNELQFRLLATEDEQEQGNAVPVLLRMVYDQYNFMQEVYPILGEYAEMEVGDPRLEKLPFESFAKQLIRAGSMSHAEWEYPWKVDRPFLILLPDIQSQRQLAGRGMTGWIKRLLSNGQIEEALVCVKAQMGCGRHCAATPFFVCQFVGLALADMALDSVELALRYEECPNLYWSLAALPSTLHDLGPAVRWELWASPSRIQEPLPEVGSPAWGKIARNFIQAMEDGSDETYSIDEAAQVQQAIEELAVKELPAVFGFSDAEIEKMTTEERIMRWIYMNYCRMRAELEPIATQSPQKVLAIQAKIAKENQRLLELTGAKESPFPEFLPLAVVGCRRFERRVKFLQTIESIRDYAGKHDGKTPNILDELELEAPFDPFTEQPFEYTIDEDRCVLRMAEIQDYKGPRYEYTLSFP